MLKVKLFRESLSVRLLFNKPILDYQGVSAVFFQFIYNALAPTYPVNVNELSTNPGFKLSEVWARFNLYGGPNTVTLFADRLSFDFVNLLPTDLPIIFDLLGRLHDQFDAYVSYHELRQAIRGCWLR